MDHATAIHYARLVSFPTAFLLSGFSLSFSQVSVPTIYDVRPQISTPVFKRVFLGGAAVVVPLALLSTSASAYLAYVLPEQRRAWAAAAVATALNLPMTRLVMMPGIARLLEIEAGGDRVQSKVEQTLEHTQLLKAWVRQNWVRAALFFVGGVAGLSAVSFVP